MPDTKTYDAVVIGAGFSGLYMLKRLRDELGMSAKVFERGGDVGGTWYWNRYPGARCDTESYLYCFSFDKQLLQDWEWSGKYPEQPEILKYLTHVADRFELRRDIQFDTRVTAAHWDDVARLWEIATDKDDTVRAKFLITAIGCLSTGNVPDIAGLDTFEGEWYHTGNWPHAPVDFSGKRVGVIGTGSSGVQSIPVIAAQAKHLTVFQRTAQYSVPARHETVNKAFLDTVKANYDAIWNAAKTSQAGYPVKQPERLAMEASEDERRATYEACWKEGGQNFFFGSYKDIVTDTAANDTASDFIRGKIRNTVKDPEKAEKLVPTEFPFGAKRALIDTDYFETYNRDTVEIVDIRRAPIREIVPAGIRTADKLYPLDTIVFATGYDAMTGPFFAIDIRGRGGAALKTKWAEGPKTHLGLSVNGFPNMFMLTGPGSPSVLSNMPVSIEQHVEFVSDFIAYLRARGVAVVEAEAGAEAKWTAHVNEIAEKTIFMKADSWYLGANIPGKPRVFMPYVGGVGEYRKKCEEIAQKHYEGWLQQKARN
jgi:cation diffusion facilitator CzcD-associated flavoprotein CzcO